MINADVYAATCLQQEVDRLRGQQEESGMEALEAQVEMMQAQITQLEEAHAMEVDRHMHICFLLFVCHEL